MKARKFELEWDEKTRAKEKTNLVAPAGSY